MFEATGQGAPDFTTSYASSVQDVTANRIDAARTTTRTILRLPFDQQDLRARCLPDGSLAVLYGNEMSNADADRRGFIAERRAGMTAIAAAAPVALLLWLAIAYLIPPLPGMDSLGYRMLFTLKCCCLAVLFCLVTGVEAVAHERLFSPAFDPLAGFETRRLRINQRYLQNTLEQILVFAAGLFGLAAYSPDGSAMRAVLATTVVWILTRFAFWIGYHRSAAMRGFGAPGMAVSMIVLLYVAARIGFEVGGLVGAVVPLVVFLAIEGFLFRATRPARSADHH